MRYSKEQIKQILRQAGFPESLLEVMSSISLAESSGDPNIINPGYGAGGKKTKEYSVGLLQINTLAHKNYTVEQLKNPLINAREALRIYYSEGLKAWGAFTDGRYKKFLSGNYSGLPNASTAPSSLPSVGQVTFDTSAQVIGSKNRYLVAFVILVIIFIFAFKR